MTEESVGTEAQGRARSWLRVVCIAAVVSGLLLAAYAWAGFRLVPRLVTRSATEYVREHYGRELLLQDVRFNPFRLELLIGRMALPDGDGGPMLSWEELAVDIDGPRSLFRRAIAFDAIRLSRPRIDVVHRTDGRWNLLDLVPADAGDGAARDGPPPRLIIDLFQVVQGAGSFTDRTRGTTQAEQVTDINFSLRDFNTLLSGNHFDLRAASPNIRAIRLEGSFSIDPLTSSGRFEIGGFSLPGFLDTWMPTFRPVAGSGMLDFDGDYELAVPTGALQFSARVPRLRVSDLALQPGPDTQGAVRVPAITATEFAVDVAARQLSVATVGIDRPELTAVLDAGGRLNLLDYLPRDASPAAAAAAPSDGSESPPWQLEVGSVALNGAQVDFTSHLQVSEPMHWRIAPLDATAGPIALPAKQPLPLQVSGSIDPSGRFSLAGTHDLDSGITSLDVDVSGLHLPVLQPVFDQRTQVAIRKGQAAAKGKLAIGGPDTLRFAGSATVGDLNVADRLNDTELVRWRRLAATGIDLRLQPLQASVRDLLFQEPFAQLVIEPNGTTNIGVALAPPGTFPPADQPLPDSGDAEEDEEDYVPPREVAGAPQAAGTAAAPAGQSLPFDIRQVRIADGSMHFTDRTLAPEFSTGILDMQGTITGLSGKPGSVADVTIDGSVDRYAPVTIRGHVNYFAAQTLTDLHMSFSNLEMTTFSPYSGKFAGYRIEKGKLNLETDYRIVDAQLDARHHIVIDQLQLGEKVESEEAVSLPLKLAVALLKDRNGVIDLDLPITGSLDDPKFRIAPIVWRMLKNLLVKVATAPFAFIGGLFGGGEEMQFIEFAPGQSTLDEAQSKKLEALRQGLVDRPGLSVDIPLVADPARDVPALAGLGWQSMLDEAAVERFGDKATRPGFDEHLAGDARDRRRQLATAYRTQFGKDPEWPKPDRKDPAQKDRDPDELAAQWLEAQLRPTVQVGEAQLGELAKARADAIQDALLRDGGVDPARVFVIVQTDAPAPAPAADPAAAAPVRVELSLK